MLASRRRPAIAAAPGAVEQDSRRLALAGPYALLVGVSLVGLALIDDAARNGSRSAPSLFWIPLLAVVLPAAVRLLAPDVPARERLQILLVLGIGLYLVKVLNSPSEFTFSDELSTLRTTTDLRESGHLFTSNSLVKAFPLYPGVDLVALAVSQASGMSVFASGLLLLGVCKVVLILSLFRLFTAAMGSARLAGVAVLLYFTNPNFVFFDSQFAYESFALPLAVTTLALVSLATGHPSAARRRLLGTAAALMGLAVVPSHHITSYSLVIVLAVWTAVVWRSRGGGWAGARMPGLVCLTTLAGIGGWFLAVGQSTSSYLQPVLSGAVDSTFDFLSGAGGGKAPFQAPGSPSNSALEQAVGVASVLILLALLGLGLLRLRRRRPPTALAVALTIVAAVYPVSLLLRLTQAGAETSNRASEFLFLGLGVVGAGVLVGAATSRRAGLAGAARLAWPALAALLFAGGMIVGWPPSSRVPGPPLVEADPRSVEPYDLDAARWAARHLPAHSRMIADRANGLVMSAYARQNPQIGAVDRLAFGALISSPGWGTTEERIISLGHIRFIVVDERLALSLPAFGVYVDHDEPEAYEHRHPLGAYAVTKYEHQPGLRRIYDNGNVSIYAVLANDPEAGA